MQKLLNKAVIKNVWNFVSMATNNSKKRSSIARSVPYAGHAR
ncbi:MAG: hypothetical protein Metus_1352 [Candidatus Methanosuratincola subterraneus]|uniref:Uncharacterized protein n=1 Tax=Methanosuratincola subterraneus TaxID=2593994 RepID=A0A444L734_METS7|nr:MAG: hypothetical protein Metus_1352 [Candidatus Methanosuratincola subterraneus]